ncbi:MAG TPA: DUF1217 domain-containing protein [Stellaceae bacterium]|nr:DUF1217 domain-containing protein [Stellaceae bacterium]
MVSTIGVPIVDYSLAVKNQANLMAQFQKWPSYAQSVTYYRDNITRVTSVDDLLNNRKLLTVALSAFQLEGSIDQKGILRKLLTQDPTATGSLAQQLLDPRYKQFAQAFAGLRSDGGTSLQNPSNINTVLAGYQANEYAKWVSNNFNDPTIRQALFFQQTVQDTIDISSTGQLFSQYQQASDVQQAVSAYKSGISQVNSVTDLLNNPKVLNVALAAFNIDPSTVTPDTLRRLLTEPTTSPTTNPTAPSLATDPLATGDLRLAQFAYTFNSLASGSGTTVQASSAVNDIITRYQRNQFAKTLAANDTTTNTIDFGTSGSNSINALLGDFQTKTGIAQTVGYYQNKIGNVTSVDGLLGDPQLLNVALGAFNIDPTKVSTAVIRQLLTNDPKATADIQAQATTLLQNDPDIARFVKTYSALSTNGGGGFTQVGSLYKQFQQQSSVQTAISHYQSTIGSVHTVAALTGDSRLLSVALTAFGLDPSKVSASTVNTLLTESPAAQAADPLVTTDARFKQFIQAFGSLNTDKGAAIGAPTSIGAIVNAYQSNAFAQTLAANNPATTAVIFTDGSTTINKLFSDYAANSGVTQPITYYQNNIGNVTSVAGLVADPKLLTVALGAFHLDPGTLTASAVTDLLSSTPSAAATALTQQNPDVAAFVAAFNSLNSDNGVHTSSAASITAITASYMTAQFKQSVEAKTEAVVANPSLAAAAPAIGNASSIATVTSAFQANQFKQSLVASVQTLAASASAGSISTLQILSNATLAAVTRGALGLPDAVGALSVPQQQTAMTNAGFDPSKLTDPTFLGQFINRFLANAGLAQSNSSTDPMAALFQAGSNGYTIPDPSTPPAGVDLSFITGNSSGGSVLDLFA